MRFPISAVMAAVLAMSAPAAGEGVSPFGDFTFKRVTPPGAGGKRITVQIRPGDGLPPVKKKSKDDTTQTADAGTAGKAPRTSPGALSWFWETVSPELTATGPGRLEQALIRIGAPPAGASVPAPRLDQMMAIAREHGKEILLRTAGKRVSPALVLAVIAVESSGRVDAVSSAGAAGLMQLMPATAERFGVSDRVNAAENIKGGVAFLELLVEMFGADPILILAGYNAGENSIATHGGVPPYAETRDYVPKVLAAFEVARSLCNTRPELITDGCVFSFPS